MSAPGARLGRGRFVVLEGIDGSGTTTQAERLARALEARGVEVCLTAEPSAGPVGALIRQALRHEVSFSWGTLALLFAADRLHHVDATIAPALARGAVVVSDRYDLSSVCYQSLASPDGPTALGWIRALNQRALRPDLTLVLGVPPALAAERRRLRGGKEELFDASEFQARLAALYARAAELLPGDHVVTLDATGDADAVAFAVLAAVDSAPPISCPEPAPGG